MSIITEAFFCSNSGKRANNEDNIYFNGRVLYPAEANAPQGVKGTRKFTDAIQVFAVCDGMGGEAAGEIASSAAVASIDGLQKALESGMELIPSLNFWAGCANDDVKKSAGYTHPGTTAVLAIISRNTLHIAHLGDSRAYLLKRRRLLRLTTDHTEAERMKRMGINPGGASKNAITRYLGMVQEDLTVTPTVSKPIILNELNSILLCSDGVSNALSEEEIIDILYNERDNPAERLVLNAAAAVNADNCTAIVIDFVKRDSKER